MQLIERIPVCNQVISGIQALISEKGLTSGEKLPTERELCAIFGVGRSTVREAMRVLQAMGVLHLQQGRGAFVGPGSHEESVSTSWFSGMKASARDYIELRLATESLSIRLAIERADETEVAEIAKTHSLFIQIVPKNDPLALAHYDEQFHMQIAKATHNELMVSVLTAIQKKVFDMRIQSFSVKGRMAGSIEPHGQILQAFYSRDAAAGVNAIVKHLRDAFQEILQD